MDTIVNITMKDIIQRKIVYCQNNTNEELRLLYEGYIRGFKQMLQDMNLSEFAFIDKYWKIVQDLSIKFDGWDEEPKPNPVFEKEIEELSGYNNAIIDILSLLDEKYMHAQD